jgi:gliding motility-associated-like protein
MVSIVISKRNFQTATVQMNFRPILLDVRNLEIFNRYGLKVYSMPNYKKWKGQTNKGEELPSATYYYVIEFNNGQTKTGWIYLIRENSK